MKHFTFYQQHDQMDCGPTCLRMIAKHYGRNLNLQKLRDLSGFSRDGISMLGIAEACESIGFKSLGVRLSFSQLVDESPFPCIIHWQQNHFIIIYHIKKPSLIQLLKGNKEEMVYLADPAKGLRILSKSAFCEHWATTQTDGIPEGIALLLEPTPAFYETEDEPPKSFSLKYLSSYLWQYKKMLFQLIVGLLLGSGLQLAFPFLTQSIVDVGIQTHNLQFIYVILAAQLMLFASRTVVEFIRSWILLHISIRINLSILSDFLIKLMKLPMSFFDTKMFGDIMQRIDDHHRIEQFLTGQTLNTLFSMISLLIFGGVLIIYSPAIFIIFLIGSVFYTFWVMLFLNERRKLDYKMFDVAAKNQGSLVALIQGMQEIKLNNAEHLKRWEWERIQTKKFQFQTKGLALNQYQQTGAFFLNEGKNILITFFAAKSVIDGQLSLGTMLAIQYIIGQLNAPIESLIQFVQTAQSAKISLERLNEIHEMQDEEPKDQPKMQALPGNKSLQLHQLNYTYPGAGNEAVLKDLNLTFPAGKVTAIVGMSGSGKTTLLKLLLKFYDLNKGDILVGPNSLKNISSKLWRSKCGVVMQDGFIFSDTIARNIAVSEEVPDIGRLYHACKVANILEFVESLPLGFNTKIGAEGNGISQGQKQRLLIARAVYKNPEYLFFDEATNALDANNEKKILENLEQFFLGRTVIVVAHRLSTVKNADQIVVLDKGRIIESGTHETLTQKRGEYFNLVRNQLELGN
ncbi:bacteriocin-processing peptidase. Cysteine peptidase. MEROPS family C39 [Pseudarcicella hirudinis]|uniref:Bacteriocin-processing peptidase. Cysteine peptidase. MEROPS family C39 n=1 Tax=Pseudarcicella hirudinis TaxID=1079859 RepID=A0A1I5QHS5_9BACT|nr:peptidase domain-containing ABC transporter [Pseudarcicella hirudinis]SFP45819.1 bacteriocin-processing peptidase. Cysteine peptidase. MEROPS family C39 [Pseudarcicella hirudinis]